MIELFKSLKRKDKAAIAELYERYGKKLYGHAVTSWKVSEDDAWELVYKTLYRVIDTAHRYEFENENRFVGFIFKIFTNYLRNHLRDHKNKQLITSELGFEQEMLISDSPLVEEEQTPDSALMRCLKKVLEVLDDWQRVLLLMRAQDYTYKDISPFVNRPEKQLKVYHLRLKKVVAKDTNLCMEKKGL